MAIRRNDKSGQGVLVGGKFFEILVSNKSPLSLVSDSMQAFI